MGVPSGTFSDAASGSLEVAFAGDFFNDISSDAGFPHTSMAGYQVLECRISSGGTILSTSYIQNTSPTAVVILAYPGGFASWTMEMIDVGHAVGGIGDVGANNLTITCYLVKR